MKRTIRNYILTKQEVFVGLEDSKRKWVLCVRSGGVVAHETTMPADYDNLRNYFHNKFPDCQINVIYEAGFRGFGLYDQIVADGWNCVVTPAHRVMEEKCNRKKNDRFDSRRLAKNLENGDYKSCAIPSKTLREDRQVSRLYGQIQRDIVRSCNRIRRMLEFHGIDQHFPPGRWTRREYRQLPLSLEKIGISPALQVSFSLLINEIEYLWSLKKEALLKLKDLAKSERYSESVNILKSAPGIGILTAIRLTLEWGDLRRFKRKENFASFLGLVPSEYSTGESTRRGRITKEGNPAVRSWLIESAWVAIRKDGVLNEKYQLIRQRTGSKKKAIVAVARKLALKLRALLLNKELYQIGVVS
ncbi:MAG: IS110 family transposase [Thermodesulfobacteriota bacterium]